MIDDETNFISCYAGISLIDIEAQKETRIGYAILYLINGYQSDSWSEVVYLADSVDGDL